MRRAYARVRAACAEIGRDPGELTYSAMTGFLVAATEADLEQRIRDQIAFTAEVRRTARPTRKRGWRSAERGG